MSNFQTIDREVISGRINGCDYGPKVRVLARTNDYLLIWAPSCFYMSGQVRARGQSSMILIPRRESHRWTIVCENERLKPSLFKQYANEIDKLLGEGFHQLLETNKTIVVGDNKPFSYTGNEVPLTGREFGYQDMMNKIALREKLISEGVSGIELEMRVQEGK